VGTYEQSMRTYAKQALAVTIGNACNAAGDRLERTAFRALLGVAEAAPPLKQAMFGAAR
jgi:hypothetical protein